MKFTVKEDFLHGQRQFEAGNTHNSDKLSLSDAELDMFYRAGWVDIEGRDPAPERNPQRAVRLDVQSSRLGTAAEKAGG
jgi:hypothetical protein